MSVAKEAILFRAHEFAPGASRALQHLAASAGDGFDVWIVGFCQQADALEAYRHPHTAVFDVAGLGELPYPAKLATVRWAKTIGHNDLPVMRFFLDHPGYERYWIVEHDVRFTGAWSSLLAELSHSDADVLGTTVQTYADNPDWASWGSVACGGQVEKSCLIKAFMPFGRLSRAALSAIDAGYRRGWVGHYEATWPTIAAMAGLSVEDIGGEGRFVPPRRKGRFYANSPLDPYLSPGCFVYRPDGVGEDSAGSWTGLGQGAQAWAAAKLSLPDMLVHPVKG
jgi:hypothetical protein